MGKHRYASGFYDGLYRIGRGQAVMRNICRSVVIEIFIESFLDGADYAGLNKRARHVRPAHRALFGKVQHFLRAQGDVKVFQFFHDLIDPVGPVFPDLQ